LSVEPAGGALMIMDACVLIDFIRADRSLLELIVNYVGPVHVIGLIVDEVREIETEEELIELGLEIVEADMEDAFIAAGGPGPLSFQDRLCLLTAKRHGFTCVTNDKRLRKECEEESVPILWGLRLLIELQKRGGISGAAAWEIARRIHKNNPKHISVEILERFKKSLKCR